MASKSESKDCFGWAARDTSGVLSPYKFNRRFKIDNVIHFYASFSFNDPRKKLFKFVDGLLALILM